jgi:hypothetical protein
MFDGLPADTNRPRCACLIGVMVDWLSAQAERPNHVAVAIKTPHGPIVEALMDRGITVFAINPKYPKQLHRFRDRFSAAGTKDDRRDALAEQEQDGSIAKVGWCHGADCIDRSANVIPRKPRR